MNEKDRQKIDLSCDTIADEVDMNILWVRLLENKIFNFDDCNIPTWKENFNSHDTKRHIIRSIKTRGPHAFKNFLTSLEQGGYGDLAVNLSQLKIDQNNRPQEKKSSDENAMKFIDSSEDEDLKENEPPTSFIFENEPLKIAVKKSKTFLDVPPAGKKDLERYIMRSKPRGFVLIVCITKYTFLETRESAKHDKSNLQKLFEEMGFEVTVTPEYIKRQELRKTIQEFAKKKDFRSADSCFVVFSCHGFEAGKRWDAEVAASDSHHQDEDPLPSEKLYCSEIIEYFSTKNCHDLRGKPKVFMFQMCRGDKHQNSCARFATDGAPNVKPTYETENENIEPPMEEDSLHRNYEDTLIVHSTIPGHYSYRDVITGAWFIQILCKVFMKEACHKHLKDLIDRVDQQVKDLRTQGKMCQTVSTYSMGFSKYCYLNPGYFGDAQ